MRLVSHWRNKQTHEAKSQPVTTPRRKAKLNFQRNRAPNRSAIALRTMASHTMIPKKWMLQISKNHPRRAAFFRTNKPWARIASIRVSLWSVSEIWTEQNAMIKTLISTRAIGRQSRTPGMLVKYARRHVNRQIKLLTA